MSEFKPSNKIALFDQSGNAAVITSGVGQNVVIASGFNTVQLTSGFNNIISVGSTVRIGTIALTNSSGGTSIGSGITPFGVRITSFSGTVAWIGGSGTGLEPFSGTGEPLFSGQTKEFKVRNVNALRGVGAASGIIVNWVGIDY